MIYGNMYTPTHMTRKDNIYSVNTYLNYLTIIINDYCQFYTGPQFSYNYN